MADDQLDLLIIFEIVRYLRVKAGGSNPTSGEEEPRSLVNIINQLGPGASVETALQAYSFKEIEMMRDQYHVGQAGAVGPNSVAVGQQFQQIWIQASEELDLSKLTGELNTLRANIRSSATGTPEEDLALAEIARAEVLAKDGNGPGMLEHLAQAGKWALDVAEKVGLPIAVKALEAALGM